MLKGIEADAARDALLRLPCRPACEIVPLADALGRVAAEDVRVRIPVPPFDRSPYDGYAFRGEDTAAATQERPAALKILEEVPAGSSPTATVTPGTAVKILTGAPIPKGANTTIKYEKTEFSRETVRIFAPVPPDTDIVYAGEDVPAGALILGEGEAILPPALGLLAGQGVGRVPVYRRPVIAVLSTGAELAEVGEPLSAAQIYNSNVYTLSGYLAGAGACPRNDGICEDEPGLIAARIAASLETADMVITTGGASVGDYDWAVTAAERLGAEILFWKTQMKPGGSMMAAISGGKLILSLSGNPGAAVLGLLKVGMPYVRQLCGLRDTLPETVTARLTKPLKKASPGLRLLRGRLERRDENVWFTENDSQGNGSVSSLQGCDLLAEIPAGSPPLPAGTVVRAFRV